MICPRRKQKYFFRQGWTTRPNHRRIERFFVARIERRETRGSSLANCVALDVAEPVIGRAAARPVGSSGLLRHRHSEPFAQRHRKALPAPLSDPGDISIGPNQHGGRRRHRAECRKLPHAVVFRIDRESGKLTPSGQPIELGMPVSVEFVR